MHEIFEFSVSFVLDEQVQFSLEAAKLAQSNASLGDNESSAGMFLYTVLLGSHCFWLRLWILSSFCISKDSLTNHLPSLFVSVLRTSKIPSRGCLFSPVYHVHQLLLIWALLCHLFGLLLNSSFISRHLMENLLV